MYVPSGKNIGNITADINKTVISGTPLQISIKPIDEYFIAGSSDLLPKAKNIPIGKHKINALILCFPIGMFLALGRRSELPAIKYSSIGFIEIWRGVPLITVLFMSAVMFPMFLPDGTYMDKLMRVVIAITLFEAAYMAEVIRGGLQALPRGQYDAAKSLGMGYWRLHLLVILPQALKLVIPGIANTFLALVKDTPLIFVVGLLELAGMIGLAKTNPKWLGMAIEGYVFAGLVFWVICYAMSRYSQRLEKRLSTER